MSTVNPIIQSQWQAARFSTTGLPTFCAASDSTALLTTANANTDWKTLTGTAAMLARSVEIPYGADYIHLSMLGYHATSPDNGTVVATIWMYREKGPAQYCASVTFTIGKRPVLNLPYSPHQDVPLAAAKYLWADTVVIGTQRWPVAIANPTDSAQDLITELRIQTLGCKRMLIELTSITADHSMMPVFTYYNT